MGDVRPHKRLEAWKQAMGLVIDVYRSTVNFPPQERYALMDQIRRAAVSIPSNIAEGAARQTQKEFNQFLHVARGSISELDTQLEIAGHLGYLAQEDFGRLEAHLDHVSRLLSGLIRSVGSDG